jgi:hypothetical protein
MVWKGQHNLLGLEVQLWERAGEGRGVQERVELESAGKSEAGECKKG